jgi:hypothetical protein
MKREILAFNRHVSGCCPGHDTFPDDTYKSNRSKQARSRDMKVEHQVVRRMHARALLKELNDFIELSDADI